MKNTFYIYNNEGLFVCLIILLLKERNVELSRLMIICTLLADSRFVRYLKSNIPINSLEQIIQNKITWFSNFNQRYLELLPVVLNSLVILQKENILILSKNSISLKIEKEQIKRLDTEVLGERIKEINSIIPLLFVLLNNYDTKRMYKLFNVRL